VPSLPSANIYVDGFNLYRRQLQQRPGTKWLDLEKLTNVLLPTHSVNRIHYFTALIKPLLGTDPRAPERQNAYLRAISVNPKTSITLGQFRSDTRLMPVVPIVLGAGGKPVTARVRKLEEKGSDVNLASRMILDASQNDADLFVLVSNDSDYASMLKMPCWRHNFRMSSLTTTGEAFPVHRRGNKTGAPERAPHPVAEASGGVIPVWQINLLFAGNDVACGKTIRDR
jgi:hypothetical protein